MKYINREAAEMAYAELLFEAELDNSVPEMMRYLCLHDLYFLLTRVLNRPDVRHDWLFERCQEVQQSPNGHLDLWAREHRKSTIVTFGLTIQDLLWDSELCIGIFSITRPLAKDFLGQIKEELETNEVLKDLFPDRLWRHPKKEAPTWSLNDGLVLRRKSNPRENTLEAYGLIEGLPTGKHFQIRVYDDVIDEKQVTNPDIIKKAVERWELSLNLGSDRIIPRYGVPNIERYVGTRYHLNDPYATMIQRKAAIPRVYPGTDNGELDGNPVFWTREMLQKKRDSMGPYIFSCQILLNPIADEMQSFKAEWFRYWVAEQWGVKNRYIVVDPASHKKLTSDYTVMLVVGLGPDGNYYVIDGVRDRLNLSERKKWLFKLHRMYRPIAVGYEQYGLQADIEHMQYCMEQEHYNFNIIPLGGQVAKVDRIKRLVPVFDSFRMFFPIRCLFADTEGRARDLTRILVDDFTGFPVAEHDDVPDCLSRILDPALGAVFPEPEESVVKDNRVSGVLETQYDVFAR